MLGPSGRIPRLCGLSNAMLCGVTVEDDDLWRRGKEVMAMTVRCLAYSSSFEGSYTDISLVKLGRRYFLTDGSLASPLCVFHGWASQSFHLFVKLSVAVLLTFESYGFGAKVAITWSSFDLRHVSLVVLWQVGLFMWSSFGLIADGIKGLCTLLVFTGYEAPSV